MKKLIAAIALTAAACAAPVFAANVGISIRVGEPGFYGQLDIDNGYSPRVLYREPVVIERRYRNATPAYLVVPREHSRNWGRYCSRYNACSRPVYFVRDEWYRDVYVPRYRQSHSHEGRDNRRNDRRDDRHDSRRDGRDDHRDRHNDRDRDRH